MRKDLFLELKKNYTSYADMIKHCTNNVLILNNEIVNQLNNNGFYFEEFTGSLSEEIFYNNNGDEITYEEFQNLKNGYTDYNYIDVYQYFIIDNASADSFKELTNEIVLYNEQLDLYILCVTHYGTSWRMISANWKEKPENE